jgi:HlyD family secretion protein
MEEEKRPSRMNKRLILIIAVVAAIGAGSVAYSRARGTSKEAAPITAAVTRGDVVEKVNATGTLQPVTTVQVGTQVSGTIKALYADFNSEVRKGQVIAELEPSLFQTQVEQARATMTRLQADADRANVEVQDTESKSRRAQELFDQKLISRNDVETAQSSAMQAEASLKSAQAQITQARAALNQVQVNLNNTIIKAPIDGVVISRSVDVGQTVAASMQAPTLFVLAQDLTRMQVSASVDESDIGRIAAGQKVSFRVDAYPADTFTGTVSQVRLNPTTEQNVVSYTTMIDVPNPEMKLKPGMTANVAIQIAGSENVLRVPNSALRFRPAAGAWGSGIGDPGSGGAGIQGSAPTDRAAATSGLGGATRAVGNADRSGGRVWAIRNGALEPVRIRTGVSDGAMTAVVEGDLKEGDQVVTGMAEQGTATAQASASPLLPFGGRRAGGAGTTGARGTGAQR